MKTMFGKRYPNCVKKEETEVVREDDMKGMSVKSGHKRPTKSGAGMTKKERVVAQKMLAIIK